MIENISCIILAGGKSSRMGVDKSTLKFKNYDTLCEYQYDKFQSIFKSVYVCTKDSSKFDFNANFILDSETKNYSPLYAFKDIINNVKTDYFFVIAVDIPFVKEEAIKKMIGFVCDGYDAIVPICSSKIHPLCGLYNKKIASIIDKNIKNNTHKLQLILKELNTKYVDFLDNDNFINLNYYDEYLCQAGVKG